MPEVPTIETTIERERARERESARERERHKMVAGGGGRVVVVLAGRCGAAERGSRERERVAEAGAGRKKRVRDFRTLNKPYGFGC